MKKTKKAVTRDAGQYDGYRTNAEFHLKRAMRYIREARKRIPTGNLRDAKFAVISAIHASARTLDALIWAESWRPEK